jgi:glucose 1-dehydrogenase
MEIDLRDKVAVVTGGAQGIGSTIALEIARCGGRVIVLDVKEVNASDLDERFSAFASRIEWRTFDLTRVSEFDKFFRELMASHGRCDILINNARAGVRTPFLEETETNWNKTLEVGLKSAFFLSQAFVRNRDLMSPGVIVNISSVASRLVTNESASYHASKSGIEQLTRYLAKNAGKYNVRVNAIAPGLIIQERHQVRYASAKNLEYRKMCEDYQPMGRVGRELDVANLVVFLCSDSAVYLSGECVVLDGGATVQDQFGMLAEAFTAKD